MNFDYKNEVLEKVLHDLELDHEWDVEHQVDSIEYLKLITDFEVPTLELDLEKFKPLFHKKMEQGDGDTLTLDFIDFAARVFI